MSEDARRSRVESNGRGNPTPQWEVFVRTDAGATMRHVGSVAAATGGEAHEHASRLFGRDAADVWLCPAEAVERYAARGLGSADGNGGSWDGDGHDGTEDGDCWKADGHDGIGDEDSRDGTDDDHAPGRPSGVSDA